MIIGVPREIKEAEQRVALTPAGAHALVHRGHRVLVAEGAGRGSGFPDDAYAAVGAFLRPAEEVWGEAELVIKVKEPVGLEYSRLRHGLTIFCYLHLAAAPELAQALRDSGATALAYETVQREDGSLPLLTPMSAVAGRLAVQEGAFYLCSARGGRGVLLGAVPGVPPGTVIILGAGTVGLNAAKAAVGLGADTLVLDIDIDRLGAVSELCGGRIATMLSTPHGIAEIVPRADLLVGGVLVPGGRAPLLVTKEMVRSMKPGAVIVDVAVDQGGCVETTRPTTLRDPVFTVAGVVHYGVTNLPALVPRTSTLALTNATLPYILALADHGTAGAVRRDPVLARGVNVRAGEIVHPEVAEALSGPFATGEVRATIPVGA